MARMSIASSGFRAALGITSVIAVAAGIAGIPVRSICCARAGSQIRGNLTAIGIAVACGVRAAGGAAAGLRFEAVAAAGRGAGRTVRKDGGWDGVANMATQGKVHGGAVLGIFCRFVPGTSKSRME
mmetsp:Transcript_40063/g.70507  ORF Transcript_40063/g.70507 Transcript_40063/m.70507 type:complete len:126 (-) Transcript_40063:1032-1409(-)